MRTHAKTDRSAQARHLQEALTLRLAKGREWATPGIEAALRRLLTQIDSGIDTASPRIQASLRTIADELAEGVEAATPRLHEQVARLIPEAAPAAKPARKGWLIVGIIAAAVIGSLAVWQVLRPLPEPVGTPGDVGGNRPFEAEQVGVEPRA